VRCPARLIIVAHWRRRGEAADDDVRVCGAKESGESAAEGAAERDDGAIRCVCPEIDLQPLHQRDVVGEDIFDCEVLDMLRAERIGAKGK